MRSKRIYGRVGTLRLWARSAFEFDEGKLRQKPIVHQIVGHHIRR
jgi:hypothetical protein